jgi:hypothetical protein
MRQQQNPPCMHAGAPAYAWGSHAPFDLLDIDSGGHPNPAPPAPLTPVFEFGLRVRVALGRFGGLRRSV